MYTCIYIHVCLCMCTCMCLAFLVVQGQHLSITSFKMDLTSAMPTSEACLGQGFTLPSTHLRATNMCGVLVEARAALSTETNPATPARGKQLIVRNYVHVVYF